METRPSDRAGSWIGGVVTVLALLGLLSPATSEAATTCSYNVGTNVLAVGGDPDVGTRLSVNTDPFHTPLGEIEVTHLSNTSPPGVDCGATDPTEFITDKIVVDHSAPDRNTLLGIREIENFAPGEINEASGMFDCPDEIEIEVDLGAGSDEIRLIDDDDEGNPNTNHLELGSAGVDHNPTSALCSDLDLAADGFPLYSVSAEGRNDRVTGQGGTAAGDPLTTPLEVDGGSGRDVIRGGNSFDELTGGPGGKDRLFGMEGSDGLFAEDGKEDSKIDCGPGLKLEEFAVIDRRKDPKPTSC